MIQRKAFTNAQVCAAGVANIGRSHPSGRPMAALNTVPFFTSSFSKVLLDRITRSAWGSSTFAWPIIDRQLLDQLMHELFSESQLPRVLLRARSGLEGGGR